MQRIWQASKLQVVRAIGKIDRRVFLTIWSKQCDRANILGLHWGCRASVIVMNILTTKGYEYHNNKMQLPQRLLSLYKLILKRLFKRCMLILSTQADCFIIINNWASIRETLEIYQGKFLRQAHHSFSASLSSASQAHSQPVSTKKKLWQAPFHHDSSSTFAKHQSHLTAAQHIKQ